AHQDIPFMPVDNADTTTWAARNAGLAALDHALLPGTDLTEMFWGYLPIPICVEVDGTGPTGFSTNNANMKIPRISLMGLPDYSMTLTTQETSDLLEQYNVLIYDPVCPVNVSCQQNLTGGGWNSAGGNLTVQLAYNRANSNPDSANRPHTCMSFVNPPSGGCPSGVACINIGEDMYYFVQVTTAEPNNPQLVRYNVGTGSIEVMSNYVEDFQILYGVDGVTATDVQDGMVTASEWLNGLEYNTNNSGPRTMMSRIFLLVRSNKEDNMLAAAGIKQNPQSIDNSTIAQPANGGDYKRRRLISRTVRMRSVL
ncbi:MAG: PilW family protein, partial [Nitrospinota bacterium]|nr:PilW family protein [Nitrospinota bacterium]